MFKEFIIRWSNAMRTLIPMKTVIFYSHTFLGCRHPPHQSDYNYLNYSLLFQEVLKQFLTSLSNLILDLISNDCLFCYVHFCNSLGVYNNEDFFPPNVRLTHVAIVTWFNSSYRLSPILTFWNFSAFFIVFFKLLWRENLIIEKLKKLYLFTFILS